MGSWYPHGEWIGQAEQEHPPVTPNYTTMEHHFAETRRAPHAQEVLPVQLCDGLWVFPTVDGVWVGLLEGSMEQGWRTSFGLLPSGDLPQIARVLNAGGRWEGGQVVITTDAEDCTISLSTNAPTPVPLRANARLQVICSAPRPSAPGRAQSTPGRPSRVQSIRAGLRVLDAEGPNEDLYLVQMAAAAQGIVSVQTQDRGGRSRMLLPALPLLVAAAEALRDGQDVLLTAQGRAPSGGPPAVFTVSARGASLAAADAQWLLPAFTRHFENRTAHGPARG